MTKYILRAIAFIILFIATTAYAGGVNVYEPKKGARLTSGNTYTIKWRYELEGDPLNPLIELYDAHTHQKKGTIATPSDADVTSCGTNMYCSSWKIPSNLDRVIRVIKVTIGSATGYSGSFGIKKKLTLKSKPNVHIDLNN